MAIAETLTELATDISNAYDSIDDKGGTLPQSKNTNNLATAIDSIQTGITPTGTISITQNGTVDVTQYATADVQVAGVETEVVTKTLTTDQNNIEIALTKGKVPKAVILESLTAPADRVRGEIYYANCFDRGGIGIAINLVTGNQSVAHYVKDGVGIYNVVSVSSTSVSFNRIISNSLFPANTTYQLTAYYWD